MIGDFAISVSTLVPGGVALMLLVVFQILTGKRIVHFKGRRHGQIHRWAGYVMALVAVVHAALGLVLAYG